MAAGKRSLFAPWVGGAGAPAFVPPAPAAGGFRGPFAFWLGAAGATAEVVPPDVVAPPAIIGPDDHEDLFDRHYAEAEADFLELMAVLTAVGVF